MRKANGTGPISIFIILLLPVTIIIDRKGRWDWIASGGGLRAEQTDGEKSLIGDLCGGGSQRSCLEMIMIRTPLSFIRALARARAVPLSFVESRRSAVVCSGLWR
ncbi:GL14935 [Drosophila persimilis]|uniref:GL14935 n=1 Tax=Drosophila persimilis TaxID=7234 RepID=B4GQ08_DROPE|nr:GL14935 [Drosophila persimilis]